MPDKLGNKFSWNVLPEKTVTNTVTSIFHDKKNMYIFLWRKAPCKQNLFLRYICFVPKLKQKEIKEALLAGWKKRWHEGKQGFKKRQDNGQCPVKNRFCLVKSLDGQKICPVIYAGKEKIQSFKF